MIRGGRSDDDTVVAIGRSVRGWVVRVATGVASAGLVATSWAGYGHRPVGPGVLVVGAALLLVTIWPLVAVVALLAVGAAVLVAGPPSLGVLLTLVLVGHVSIVAATLAARVWPSTRVEWRVVGALAREAAIVQVGAQVLALGAAAVAGAHVHAGDLVRAVAVLLALGALVAVLPPARTARPR